MDKMTVNNKEYSVIKLLGHGKGGYSYLVTDDEKRYVLKQIHHEPCSYYEFGDKLQSEMNDYHRLREIGIYMPVMYEVDKENERILKEYIEGDTIYDFVLRDEMKPKYVEQMRKMCQLLYPTNTNIDYFPTNFVVQNDEIYYIDYECNDYMEEWNFENWGIKYWSKTKEFINYVNKAIVEKFIKEAYVNHNYNKVLEVLAKDYSDHSPSLDIKGSEKAIEILRNVEKIFTDLSVEIMDIFEEDGRVAIRLKFSGIHSGECMGIDGTRKLIVFEVLEIFKLNNGIIIESWGAWPDSYIKEQIENYQTKE